MAGLRLESASARVGPRQVGEPSPKCAFAAWSGSSVKRRTSSGMTRGGRARARATCRLASSLSSTWASGVLASPAAGARARLCFPVRLTGLACGAGLARVKGRCAPSVASAEGSFQDVGSREHRGKLWAHADVSVPPSRRERWLSVAIARRCWAVAVCGRSARAYARQRLLTGAALSPASLGSGAGAWASACAPRFRRQFASPPRCVPRGRLEG